MTTSTTINLTGVDGLPDGDWYELRIRLRRIPGGTEACVQRAVPKVDGPGHFIPAHLDPKFGCLFDNVLAPGDTLKVSVKSN